ncbi:MULTISPECIES: hypothetical protein [unclassified Streptomyces]|uniref:hypothetical protein n=1 Tax=unclassified Streptomyces TaxID=2593676 RepID=UPI003636F113
MTTGLTKYDRRMYTVMNRREGRPFYATAARRRAIVCAHIALTVAGVAGWTLMVFADRMWSIFVLLGALLPWCVATGLINGATRGLLELRGRALDERQLRERDTVLARAHRLTSLLLLAAAVGIGFLGWLGEVRVEALVTPVLIAVLVPHWLMPLWVAGLTVRDEPDEE